MEGGGGKQKVCQTQKEKETMGGVQPIEKAKSIQPEKAKGAGSIEPPEATPSVQDRVQKEKTPSSAKQETGVKSDHTQSETAKEGKAVYILY